MLINLIIIVYALRNTVFIHCTISLFIEVHWKYKVAWIVVNTQVEYKCLKLKTVLRKVFRYKQVLQRGYCVRRSGITYRHLPKIIAYVIFTGFSENTKNLTTYWSYDIVICYITAVESHDVFNWGSRCYQRWPVSWGDDFGKKLIFVVK